eukprot:TRINITY_DN1735_c0_g2_i2.p3 TRINITY_DN1735_c0_g2~~TRINITY_DN1735_c0_g2_i2.p3  ORF type:complete len:123 (+),score=4.98 TRINITY_DN1735_c0_g2_i2:460-828(+)
MQIRQNSICDGVFLPFLYIYFYTFYYLLLHQGFFFWFLKGGCSFWYCPLRLGQGGPSVSNNKSSQIQITCFQVPVYKKLPTSNKNKTSKSSDFCQQKHLQYISLKMYLLIIFSGFSFYSTQE